MKEASSQNTVNVLRNLMKNFSLSSKIKSSFKYWNRLNPKKIVPRDINITKLQLLKKVS